MLKVCLAVALLALTLGCAPPEPTPTLGPAPTPEVAPPPPDFEPTLTPEDARALAEIKRLRGVVRDIEDEINEVTRWCWPESAGERYQEEAWRLDEDSGDSDDLAVRERQLTELVGKLQPLLREAETVCDEDRETVRRLRGRGPTVDLADASVSLVALGFASAFAGQVIFGLATGGLCGRYMRNLTIRRGLPWGLVAAALVAPLVAFLSFPGREFLPSAVWPMLTVALTAAVCWLRNRRGNQS